MHRAEIGLDGSYAFALIGNNIQDGDSEWEPIKNWPDSSYHDERAAAGRALNRLRARHPKIGFFLGAGLRV